MSPVIRIDDEVYAALKQRAEPFEDTPNSVLRRLVLNDHVPAKPRRDDQRFRRVILEELHKLGGRATRASVMAAIESRLGQELSAYEREELKSGWPRWHRIVDRQVTALRDKGSLEPASDDPAGMWELSPSSRKAQQAMTRIRQQQPT
jgi:hypothetical protein